MGVKDTDKLPNRKVAKSRIVVVVVVVVVLLLLILLLVK